MWYLDRMFVLLSKVVGFDFPFKKPSLSCQAGRRGVPGGVGLLTSSFVLSIFPPMFDTHENLQTSSPYQVLSSQRVYLYTLVQSSQRGDSHKWYRNALSYRDVLHGDYRDIWRAALARPSYFAIF
jgi:hypothetical protein